MDNTIYLFEGTAPGSGDVKVEEVTGDSSPNGEKTSRFVSGVPAELHVFKRGSHGFAIRKANGPITSWTNLCREWMLELLDAK